MTTTDRAAILAKIKRLLALSQSSNEHEAAAAAAAASRIMEAHRVSEAEIAAETGEGFAVDSIPLYEGKQDSAWRTQLGMVLCRAHGVFGYGERGPGSFRVRLVGLPSDCELVRFLFAWCGAEIERLTEVELRRADEAFEAKRAEATKNAYLLGNLFEQHRLAALKSPKQAARRWRISFQHGAVAGIDEQIKAAKAAAREGASSTALVRLADHDKNVEAFARQKLDLASARSRKVQLVGEAYRSGVDTGKAMHLGAALPGVPRGLKS